jgi:hypothetical protein
MADDSPEESPDDLPEEGPDVTTYTEIEAEVQKRFDGNWETFLKAVTNPAEILHFILKEEFELDKDKFEAWAKGKDLPSDWIPRFYSALTEDGELPTRTN